MLRSVACNVEREMMRYPSVALWMCILGCGSSEATPPAACDGGSCVGPSEGGTSDVVTQEAGDAANGCDAHTDTDGKNCGACGHDCLGGACVNGLCRPFSLYTVPSGANQIVTPTAIVSDGDFVYVGLFDTRGGSGGSIIRLPAAGGAAETLVANLPYGPSDLVVDGATLFFGLPGGNSSSTPGSVLRMPTSGGTPTTIATAGGYRIALDPTRVYWSDNFAHVMRTSRDRVDADGGADAGAIEDFLLTSSPQGIAVDSTSVYVAATGSQALQRVPIGGGAAVTMATIKVPREVRLDASHVFVSFNDPYELGIERIPFGVGTELKYTGAYVVDFVIDASNVYWLEAGPARIGRSPIDKAAPGIIDEPKAAPGRIAIDAKAIYYTLGAGQDYGQIVKLAK